MALEVAGDGGVGLARHDGGDLEGAVTVEGFTAESTREKCTVDSESEQELFGRGSRSTYRLIHGERMVAKWNATGWSA